MQTNNLITTEEETISIKDIILILKENLGHLKKRWYFILLAVLVFDSLFFVKYFFLDKIKYTASMGVLLNTNNASGLGSIMGGLGLGFGNQDVTALDKVTAIMKSQEIIGRSLLMPTALPAKNGILANYFADSLGYKKNWRESKDPVLKSFTEFKSHSLDSCSAQEWQALQDIRGSLTGKKGLEFKVGEEGILAITYATTNELLTVEILDNIYEQTDRYYMNNDAKSDNDLFKSIQKRRDSISQALAGKQSAIASYKERNTGTLFPTEDVPIAKMQQDIMILASMKGEVMKNYELSKLSLETKQPYIRALDLPRSPLVPEFPSLLKNMLIGTILGLILSCGPIIGIKQIQSIMA